MTKQYDDWVIEEAARRMDADQESVNMQLSNGWASTAALCDLIQETQKEAPSDLVLEEARDRFAAKCEDRGSSTTARYYRAGKYDVLSPILVAIDLINERNALQAELDAVKLERDNLQKARDSLLEEITPLRNAAFTEEFPEPKPLDPHAPLEARHKDGRVVSVELDCLCSRGRIWIKRSPHVLSFTGGNVFIFTPCGTHRSGEWTLHNRVQS